MKKIITVISFFLVLFPCFVMAQDGNNTLYFLSNSPQRVKLNPAYQPEYKTYVGIPGLSGISLNLSNAFKVDDLLRWGTGDKADSVIYDVNRLHKALREKNSLVLNTEIPILAIGFRINSWYATFDITQKNDIVFSFNKDIITFFKEGNANYLGQTFDWGGLGLKVTAYNEIGFGLSKRVNDRLTVGGRFKVLFGIANADMTDSKMGVYSSPDGDTIRLSSRQNIRVSAPIKYTKDGEYVEWDNIEFDEDAVDAKFLIGTGNLGFGVDLGAQYKLLDKLTLYASVLDLGFIRWEENTYNFKQNTSFDWTGADLSNSLNKDDPNYKDFGDAFEEMTDSLENRFRLTDKQAAYTTMLNAKIYAGATYQLKEWVNFGGLLKASVMDGRFFPAITLSANLRPIRNIGASVSYSMINGDFANVGAALTAKFGPFQFFVMTDNVLAANYTSTRTASARFGFNLLFGHYQRR
ncbi:DUF5723 family protein [Gabonibacter chumensis]|uniref:DUF5723 family protein n=1 Tax=Gabonibacter chumensis TaxID=2972474 RepID=UPI002572E0EC|nr:DUF5723 family protein [Gabonibacter chumensis]MCR9012990.1 DUF5723 family protein [Gabonibacter chumensis]